MRLCRAFGVSANARFLWAILCILAYAAEVPGQPHIRSYGETICIAPNGSAQITTTISMGEYAGSSLSLPLNYLWVEKISASIRETGEGLPRSNPDPLREGGVEGKIRLERGLPVEIVTSEGADSLCITLGQKDISGKTLVLTFRDPAYLLWKNAGPGDFGLYEYKSEFQNTSRFVMDEFSMEVILPEGFALHRITKTIPALTKRDPTPPYSFVNLKGTSHLFIKAHALTPGKSCMIGYTFVKKRFSYALLSGCIILIILSLVIFRDVLKEGADASHPK